MSQTEQAPPPTPEPENPKSKIKDQKLQAPAPPTLLDALLADIRMLDYRLQREVERVRQTIPQDSDPGNRGLLIEESDVDGWLARLGPEGKTAQRTAPGDVPASSMPVGFQGGRLHILGDMFGLGRFERAAILTALAPEVDVTYANLYAYVQDDVTKKHPTLDLVLSLWCDTLAERLEGRRLLGPDGGLRRHFIMSLDDSAPVHSQHSSILVRPLTLDPRIAAFLLGADEPDVLLSGAARVVRPSASPESTARTEAALPDNQVQSLAQLALALLVPPQEGGRPVRPRRGLTVWMRGPERQAKRVTAEQMALTLGCPLLVVDTPLMVGNSSGASSLRSQINRALRETHLQGGIVFWQDADVLIERKEEGGADFGADLARLLPDWYGCALVDLRTAVPPHIPGGPVTIEIDFPAPSNENRLKLWERALGRAQLADDVNMTLLVGAFRLTGDQIEASAETARQTAAWRAVSSGNSDEARITMRDLLSACRAHSNQGLGMLARKVTPHYTWEDLVLPIDRLNQLHEMCYHIRFGPVVFEQWGFDKKLARGKGLNVLFAGQPGTGKTMAAEVLATDLGLELYKIDLSSVVSKYIGETEKNLERIFHEGQTSNAILFFDEADSLFGKRSEVKDSHDRYANIEIAYLLQRMEEYDGIVILATNLRKNMDEAFVRRMHGAIEFPMPEELDRLEIWRRTFPAEAPVGDDLDLEFMARKFKMSGGNIKNIVLEAAFFAAQEEREINMAHVVRATRREHQKIGKLFHEDDFGPYARFLKGEEQEQEPDFAEVEG